MFRTALAFSVLCAIASAQPAVVSRKFDISELRTPPGFSVSVYARLPASARMMALGPNGVLYAASPAGGAVYAIAGPNTVTTVLSGLGTPHSLAFRGNDLYIAIGNGILRYANAVTDDLVIRGNPVRIANLPTGAGHWTRTIGFSPDDKLYATAGSSCNFCRETDPRRAAMMRMDPDGSNQEIYARGLRNSVGFAWHPVDHSLWATENGGDGLGDQVPPEEINLIQQGGDFGWPDCYDAQVPASWGDQAQPQRCPDTIGPALTIPAHSAPLGISFYTGKQFPVSYTNNAFVALHGSWNRNDPTGYKVVRIREDNGRPVAAEDFLWGFLNSANRTQSGRPVHPLQGPDGSLYISDDDNANLYIVRYDGPRIDNNGIAPRDGSTYSIRGSNLSNDPSQFILTVNGQPIPALTITPTEVQFVMPDGTVGTATVTVSNGRAADQATVAIPPPPQAADPGVTPPADAPPPDAPPADAPPDPGAAAPPEPAPDPTPPPDAAPDPVPPVEAPPPEIAVP